MTDHLYLDMGKEALALSVMLSLNKAVMISVNLNLQLSFY